MTKNKLKFGLLLALSFIVVASQAVSAQDLNFSVNTTVTIGSTNYTINAGSAATSMVIGVTTLTVTVPALSTFVLVSPDRYLLNADQVISQQCTPSQNSLSITGSITVVITPNPTAVCTVSGGGGGGGPIDTTPPTNTSIVINSGAATASTTAVTLTLSAVDASEVMISNDSAFTGGVWLVYSTSKTWTLTSGDGVKTVYAKFRDASLNVSAAVSDTITLITSVIVPSVAVVTPAIPATPSVKALPYAQPKTVVEMQANLNVLLENLAVLQAALKAMIVTPTVTGASVPPAGSYKIGLTLGSKGNDVIALQNFLKSQGADIYPEGLVTGFYGNLTKAAIGRFQIKHGIVTSAKDIGYGYVGPKTRAKINQLLGL